MSSNFTTESLSLTPTAKSYKILQRLSPKHAVCGVAHSANLLFIYGHGKAYLSKQLPWRAAWDSSGRS